jgi:hypothetical protein
MLKTKLRSKTLSFTGRLTIIRRGAVLGRQVLQAREVVIRRPRRRCGIATVLVWYHPRGQRWWEYFAVHRQGYKFAIVRDKNGRWLYDSRKEIAYQPKRKAPR